MCYVAFVPTGSPSSSDITITNQCLTQLPLSWKSNSDDYATCGPISYNVTISQFDQTVQIITVNNTSCTLTGLVPATNYTITINSSNNAGHSVSSSNASTMGCKCIMCSEVHYKLCGLGDPNYLSLLGH